LDEPTRNELRINNILFNYKNPWEPRHIYMGKIKAHHIELLLDSKEEGEAYKVEDDEKKRSSNENPHEDLKSGAIDTLSSDPIFHTFKIWGVVHG
jgi:hypothetical protein